MFSNLEYIVMDGVNPVPLLIKQMWIVTLFETIKENLEEFQKTNEFDYNKIKMLLDYYGIKLEENIKPDKLMERFSQNFNEINAFCQEIYNSIDSINKNNTVNKADESNDNLKLDAFWLLHRVDRELWDIYTLPASFKHVKANEKREDEILYKHYIIGGVVIPAHKTKQYKSILNGVEKRLFPDLFDNSVKRLPTTPEEIGEKQKKMRNILQEISLTN